MTEIVTIRRQLKIKTGAVERLFRETKLYRDEVKELENKKIKLVTEGAEEWDIKNAARMIDESNMMVEDTTKRLKNAIGGLVTSITDAKQKGEMSQDEELSKAETILQETKFLVEDEELSKAETILQETKFLVEDEESC